MDEDATRYDMRTAEVTAAREHALAQLRRKFAHTTRSIFNLINPPCAAKASVAPHTFGGATSRGLLGSDRTKHSIAMNVLPELIKR